MDILIGILAILIGLILCFSGLRLFFFLLPIAGFVVGFFAGAGFVSWAFGDGFLQTTLGLVIGVVVGLVFAVLSYLYWYIGVILTAASAGAVFGTGLFAALGATSGWALLLASLAGAVLFAVLATVLNYPIYLVIFATALQGAVLVIAGALLALNQIDRHELILPAVWAKIQENWLLWLVWLLIAAVGIVSQLQVARTFVLPGRRWEKAERAS